MHLLKLQQAHAVILSIYFWGQTVWLMQLLQRAILATNGEVHARNKLDKKASLSRRIPR